MRKWAILSVRMRIAYEQGRSTSVLESSMSWGRKKEVSGYIRRLQVSLMRPLRCMLAPHLYRRTKQRS